MKTYKCNHCEVEETEDLEVSKWIIIGGKGNTFFFKDFDSETNYSNWSAMHFCSHKCFIDHFLKD